MVKCWISIKRIVKFALFVNADKVLFVIGFKNLHFFSLI